MTTMQEIEALTKVYSDEREALRERLQVLRDEFEQSRREHMDGIKTGLARVAAAHDLLLQVITDNPGLFEKPRSQVLNGLRVGWRKNKESVAYANAERTVALIEQHLPDRAATLINVEKTPIAAAIARLTERDQLVIGVSIKDGIDAPFIAPAGDEFDKLMKALLKNREEAAAEEAVA